MSKQEILSMITFILMIFFSTCGAFSIFVSANIKLFKHHSRIKIVGAVLLSFLSMIMASVLLGMFLALRRF